jgi:hypothetical protein
MKDERGAGRRSAVPGRRAQPASEAEILGIFVRSITEPRRVDMWRGGLGAAYLFLALRLPVPSWSLIVLPLWARAGSAPTTAAFPDFRPGRRPRLPFSRPAQHSLALRPVCSRSRLTTFSIEGFDVVITSFVASIVTGWSDQLAGWESHPLKVYALARRT